MLNSEIILKITGKKKKVTTQDLVKRFKVSRQYASSLIAALVAKNELIKVGSTRKSFYVLPSFAKKHKEIFALRYAKTFRNIALEEHRIIEDIETTFSPLRKLPENIRSIFTYAFSEMMNNAIEHSKSQTIGVEVFLQRRILFFTVNDSGIGVFRNIMKKRSLESELEAVQDLLKGKTTTMPKSHSGEGIFFTSKVGDVFVLESFGYRLMVDNRLPDVFIESVSKKKKGTKVQFQLHTASKLHLNDVFKKYTNLDEKSDFGFDKTEIRVKLYTLGGIHISRSQARRVLSGLEKFKVILFDFDKVSVVGQAFADEIFRVFHTKYPHIKLETENMNEGVQFMVVRSMNEARNG